MLLCLIVAAGQFNSKGNRMWRGLQQFPSSPVSQTYCIQHKSAVEGASLACFKSEGEGGGGGGSHYNTPRVLTRLSCRRPRCVLLSFFLKNGDHRQSRETPG